MRTVLAALFLQLAVLVGGGGALYTLIAFLKVLMQMGGLMGVIVGVLLAPLTAVLLPFYAGFFMGDWSLLWVPLVTGFTASALANVSVSFHGKSK